MAISRSRVAACVVLLLMAGSAFWVIKISTHKPAPASIAAPFPVFLTTDAQGASYDAANRVLTFDAIVQGKKVVVTEQLTPQIFSENGVYSFKLNQAHDYATFESNVGQVDLTRPDGLNGQTIAWNQTGQGTFILAHALQELNEDQWKLLFNSMAKK